MSLIPSESYSFPDHFVRTVSPPRKPVEEKVSPPPRPVRSEGVPKNRVASQIRENSILPTPKREQAPQPPRPVPQTQAKRPLLASLVPKSLKRKARWNMRAMEPVPAADLNIVSPRTNGAREEIRSSGSTPVAPLLPKPKPAVLPKISLPPPTPPREHVPPPVSRQPEPIGRVVEAPSADLVQTLLARSLYAAEEPVEVTPRPPSPAQVRPQTRPLSTPAHNGNSTNSPIAAVAASDEDFALELFNDEGAPAKKRRSPKLRKFLLWEAVAIGILIPLSILGFSRFFQDPLAVLLINVATITAAVAATLMPIFFFALAPPLPRGDQ
jgi:hypothetical protein